MTTSFYRHPELWLPEIAGTHVDLEHLSGLYKEEEALFESRMKKSKAMHERAVKSMPNGVTNSWQSVWHVPHPFYITNCKDNRVTDIDGNEYIDFNLGDTPDFYGHSPKNAVTQGIIELLQNSGINTLVTNEDAVIASELLTERFGLPYWFTALSASDANRFAVKLAKLATGRNKVLQFNMAYHGTLDETNAWMPEEGVVEYRVPEIYPGQDPTQFTRVATFNDLASVEEQLKHGDVSVVLTEPALSNSGLTLPKPGFHDGLRELCTKYGTLLLIDETHMQTTAHHGATGEWGLKPDIWVAGKCIAGGIPCGVYGFSEAVANLFQSTIGKGPWHMAGLLGQQTTMTGNALSLRALRLNLEHNVTKENFDHMISTNSYLTQQLNAVIQKHGVPLSTEQVGARTWLHFCEKTPVEIEDCIKGIGIVGHFIDYIFMYLFNRGVMIIPFGLNMWLVSPQTTKADCDVFAKHFEGAVINMFQLNSVPTKPNETALEV
ncbi:transaminase [Photobacterium sanguinicancri]|uniref:Transaminase n=1 Tax=Photobacterium sanguinicancri TaxID=875932 RepID=A0AAW7Y907_9GAMM|nr:transaminase [Photobacterium sanguinicancri]MDO6544226.1 transaminase [Photobacterium sanguinicancri]